MAEGAQTDVFRWRWRDGLAAVGLFLATAAVVLWQNAHVAVLWDLSYVLDTATRIAQGQMPYRDFPLAHAPLAFLAHAAIIRLTGRVFFHHVLYVAAAGGLGTVLAWRLVLRALAGRVAGAWWLALILAVPLTVLGLYCVFPHPSYDCAALLYVLLALLLLRRLADQGARAGVKSGLAAGAALTIPLFAKQNIGLAFLATSLALVVLLLVAERLWPERVRTRGRALAAVALGAAGALAFELALLEATVGLGNYLHWTIGFAATRRMPALAAMVGMYSGGFLLWALAASLGGLALLRGPLAKRRWAQSAWTRRAAFLLLASPWLYALATLLIYDNAEDQGDALLALWPPVLALAAALMGVRLVETLIGRRAIGLEALLPLAALAAIHGTLMSQQLWGSTYALWPLFVDLLAELVGWLAAGERRMGPPLAAWIAPSLVVVTAVALLLCGGSYMVSEERLSYADLPEGPVSSSVLPALRGMATPGPYLENFDELVAYTERHIPREDAILLLPGEDPFYFATGRTVQFPVLLFDPATDPYPPESLVDEARQRQVKWLVEKRDEQIDEDPMPGHETALTSLEREFHRVARLKGYDVYRAAEASSEQEP